MANVGGRVQSSLLGKAPARATQQAIRIKRLIFHDSALRKQVITGRTGSSAVLAVVAARYQRTTSRYPRKSWAVARLASEKQRGALLFCHCFPLFLL
jgi:hypothetical protein